MRDWKMNAKDETLHIHWLSAGINEFVKWHKQDCGKFSVFSVWVRHTEFSLCEGTRVLFCEEENLSIGLFIFSVGNTS